jgi:hypothetical protein
LTVAKDGNTKKKFAKPHLLQIEQRQKYFVKFLKTKEHSSFCTKNGCVRWNSQMDVSDGSTIIPKEKHMEP